MSKLIAKCDFINSAVGNVKAGDVLPDNPTVRDLMVYGYVGEEKAKTYKTKVVHKQPEQPKHKESKKSKNKYRK